MRLFAPDVAMVAAVAALIILALSGAGTSLLFRDADAGWHIRAGQTMLATGSLPVADPYSFSKPGAPWMAWEWAADVASAAAFNVGGLPAVAWMYAMAIAASVWLWFRVAWKGGATFLVACAFAAPMISTASLHWLARPHVFGWLFLLATVLWCESQRRATAGVVVTAFAFGAAWANVHGSFFFAGLIPALYALGRWKADRRLLIPAGAAMAGTLINPHGRSLHLHVTRYLTDSDLISRIAEFQTFNFNQDGAAQILLALLLCATGAAAAFATRRMDRFLVLLVISVAAMRTARMLPVAAMVVLPLAAASITELLRERGWTAYSDRLRVLDARAGGYAWLPLIALFAFALVRTATFPVDQFPTAAVAQLPANARVFSSDKFGGYLIYRFAGERKVFFDGRSDFYGADFMKKYNTLAQARPGWREGFAAWNFTHALVPPDSPLADALPAAGWNELYRDKVAVLLRKEGLSR